MISTDREFHFTGELIIKRSNILNSYKHPKDDKVNWLFMKIGERQFSFIYKIDETREASYDKPFNAKLSFMLIEEVKKLIQLNQTYEVLRGPEPIGDIKIITAF